jgi:hypothetical protein
MFWSKKTTESEDFQVLFKKFENLRVEVEGIKIDLALYKNKLFRKAGIMVKEEETETNKNPSILLNPNGNPIVSAKSSQQ